MLLIAIVYRRGAPGGERKGRWKQRESRPRDGAVKAVALALPLCLDAQALDARGVYL